MREQHGSGDDAGDLEARRDDLAKRLAARQAEKGPLRQDLRARAHLRGEELEVYLADLKNQASNLRLHLESVEAELSQQRQQMVLADTTHAWLLSLRRRLTEVEQDTPEAFRERRRLVELLVESISVGKQEDGRAEIRITYRFGPSPVYEVSEVALSMVHRKNGRASSTPDTNIPTLTVVAVR